MLSLLNRWTTIDNCFDAGCTVVKSALISSSELEFRNDVQAQESLNRQRQFSVENKVTIVYFLLLTWPHQLRLVCSFDTKGLALRAKSRGSWKCGVSLFCWDILLV